MAHHWKLLVVVAATASLSFVGAGAAQAAAAPSCTKDVGHTGLSALIVARSHQVIAHRTISAAGCDVGIYVGPKVTGVRIDDVTVTGANFDGILAERTSYLVVEHSTITGNAFHTIDASAPALPGSGVHSFVAQSFGISLFGVTHSTITDNDVYNNGRGGIGIMDIGAFDPGALTQNTKAAPAASANDVVSNNRLRANYNGCAIVVATQNPGGRIIAMTISGNTITGTGMSKTFGPDVGGIVVAANTPGSSAVGVSVHRNTISKSFEGGVIVNAESFNSSTWGVTVDANIITGGNNWGKQEAPQTAGIIVFANPQAEVPPNMTAPRNQATLVWNNTISGQFYGIWSAGDDAPLTLQNRIHVTTGGTAISHS
jgi:hypothetical protein